MARNKSSVVGIDIGSQSIKVAELKMQGGQPTVTALGIAETPPGSVDHIGIHDPEAVGLVVKQLCGSSGAGTADVVVSIAGQGSVLVRTLEVPNMNAAELRQQMDWEVTRNIPFAESDVVSDFQAFPPKAADSQNIDVVMAISPQSKIQDMVKLVKQAGKKAHSIDVEPLGLARSLKMSYEDDYAGKSVCVVEIGHKTTSINIYKNGELQMPRQVPIGGEMFTRAIAEALSISFEEAQALKHAKAIIPESAGQAPAFDAGAATQEFTPYNPFEDAGSEPAPEAEVPDAPAPVAAGIDEEQSRIFAAISPTVEEFASEVRRSIDYHRSKGGEVDAIHLCGGGAKLQGIGEFIATALGLPTIHHNPLKDISVADGRVAAEWTQNPEEFAVAIGNSLHICFSQ